LAGEPDGHFGALLWDATANPPVLYVKRYDKTGAPGFSTSLADALAGRPTSASARAGSSSAAASMARTSTSTASRLRERARR